MREANSTFVDIRSALTELRPTLRLAQPVAPRLAATLKTLAPLTREATPTLADLRGAVPDLSNLLAALPALEQSAVPAFETTTDTLQKATPIVEGARVAVPEVVNGLFTGFAGSGAGYWDANGALGRVGIAAGQFSLTGAAELLPLPPLLGASTGNTARCPGAAAPPEDGSIPYSTKELPCDPKQVVK
jgi:phospholipid/cholesterol/gamma-HCH transport system substrate-binding protein